MEDFERNEGVQTEVMDDNTKNEGVQAEVMDDSTNRKNPKLGKKRHFGRFLALGTSGAGKTSFMIGIYDKLISGNWISPDPTERSFTLSLQGEQERDIRKKWKKIKENNSSGRTSSSIDGTQINKYYMFTFNANYHVIQQFQWIDYRGGIITEDKQGKDYDNLKEAVLTSDVLYIFVDGSLIAPATEYRSYEELKKSAALSVRDSCAKQLDHFLHLFPNRDEKIPPIAIVITKYDLIKNKFRKYTQDDNSIIFDLNEIIKDSFTALLAPKSFEKASDILVGIFPVSIGMDFEKTGNLDPCNIQAPLYFGLCNILYKLRKAESDIQDIKIDLFEKICNQIDNVDIFKIYMNGDDSEKSLEKLIKKYYEDYESSEGIKKLLRKASKALNKPIEIKMK